MGGNHTLMILSLSFSLLSPLSKNKINFKNILNVFNYFVYVYALKV